MIGILISFLLQFLLLSLSLLDVGLDVKVGKENKEQSAVEENHVAEYFREITLDEERKAGVNEEGHELPHLQPCQISEKNTINSMNCTSRTIRMSINA